MHGAYLYLGVVAGRSESVWPFCCRADRIILVFASSDGKRICCLVVPNDSLPTHHHSPLFLFSVLFPHPHLLHFCHHQLPFCHCFVCLQLMVGWRLTSRGEKPNHKETPPNSTYCICIVCRSHRSHSTKVHISRVCTETNWRKQNKNLKK